MKRKDRRQRRGDHATRDALGDRGITVRILGDFEPFSKVGKSIGYQVTVGRYSYLIDCGAPLFQQITSKGIAEIKGVVLTHCHDDHKRWFTDLLLYKMYKPHTGPKISLLTSEDVLSEVAAASGPSLNRSLSGDSRQIVDIPFERYLDFTLLGPRARYRIVSKDEGEGRTTLSIVDRHGAAVGPDQAKIVINPETKRPRMLFKDPEYREWIEPESFYPFTSNIFYEEEQNVYRDDEGFSIAAIKAPVWHGIAVIGLAITTADETLLFSSDTVHDLPLWKNLSEQKRKQRLPAKRKAFEEAAVIYGDINDFIERTWSRERYCEAEKAFQGGVVIHDVASKNSVVHTDYEKLERTSLDKKRTILTHSPDTITSEWVLCGSEKVFFIKGDRFYEVADDTLYEMNASIYHREAGHYYVGYRSEAGRYVVYKRDGLLGIAKDGAPQGARQLYRVDLYEDIGGRYYPKVEGSGMMYRARADGKVELVTFTEEGSVGRIAENVRGQMKGIRV